MNLRPVQLPDGVGGALWLSGMPGRFGTWSDFEQRAHTAGLAMIVCLTPRDEIEELAPEYAVAIQRGACPFQWVHLPLPNFGVPPDAVHFRKAIERVADRLRAGDAVLMHCAAGMGRTGSAAACVLKALGLDADEALARIRAAGSNPQNAAQAGFVNWF